MLLDDSDDDDGDSDDEDDDEVGGAGVGISPGDAVNLSVRTTWQAAAGAAAGRQTRRTAARQERYTDVTERDPGCLRAAS